MAESIKSLTERYRAYLFSASVPDLKKHQRALVRIVQKHQGEPEYKALEAMVSSFDHRIALISGELPEKAIFISCAEYSDDDNPGDIIYDNFYYSYSEEAAAGALDYRESEDRKNGVTALEYYITEDTVTPRDGETPEEAYLREQEEFAAEMEAEMDKILSSEEET